MSFQSLLQAIDPLSLDQLEAVERYIHERRRGSLSQQLTPDIEAPIEALHTAAQEFREGLSADELALIVRAMNGEDVNPKDLTAFDWLEDSAEDER